MGSEILGESVMSVRTLLVWLLVSASLILGGRILAARPDLPFLAVDGAVAGKLADAPPDYITLATRFRPTTDRNGDTVAGFRWRLFTGRAPQRVEILRGYAKLDTVTLDAGRVVLRWRVGTPYPGDTINYSYSLRAVDRYGIPSAEVWSGYTRLIGAWGPPEPLIIPIDTVTTGADADSIKIVFVDVAPADTIQLRTPGDTSQANQNLPTTVQLCVIVWRHGERFMARDLAPACYQRVSAPIWRNTA